MYICVCIMLGCSPTQDAIVASEGFISGSPTKNVIFLLVTVSRRDFPSMFICFCHNLVSENCAPPTPTRHHDMRNQNHKMKPST